MGGKIKLEKDTTTSDSDSEMLYITHDVFFKKHFGNKSTMIELLSVLLPKDLQTYLQLDQISIEPGSYIDKKYRQNHSDILVKIPAKNHENHDVLVYTVVEHKSLFEELTPYQMLQYMMGVWREYVRQYKKKLAKNNDKSKLKNLCA